MAGLAFKLRSCVYVLVMTLCLACTFFISLRMFSSSCAKDVSSSEVISRRFGKAVLSTPWILYLNYPTIYNRTQAWSWVETFLESVNQAYLDDNISSKQMRAFGILKDIYNQANQPTTICTLQFPMTEPCPLENQVLNELSPKHERNYMLRYDCATDLCDSLNSTKTEFRSTFAKQYIAEIIFLNFLHADIKEVGRLLSLSAISGSVKAIVTSIRTESHHQTRDYNYPRLLYDLFIKIYFLHDWMPVVGDISHCTSRFDCSVWLLWIPWTDYRNKITIGAMGVYIPPADDGSTQSELQRQVYYLTHPNEMACLSQQQFGGHLWQMYGFMEGAWTICLDVIPKLNPTDCLVYSFGIANDWSFDDHMQHIGCTVFSFDPSLKLQAHQRAENHWFYPWGLPVDTRTIPNNLSPNWTLLPMQAIRTQLGHLNRHISVLKMDVEGAEWTFLHSDIAFHELEDVDQVLFETDRFFYKDDDLRLDSFYLHLLEKLGFILFNSRANPHCADFPDNECVMYELSYLNQRSVK